jgi:acetyl esterase/lipase
MRSFFRPLSLLLAAALSGCSAADLVNLATPSGGYDVETDIRYGTGERRTLDLYVPATVRAGSPVVVFIYGGNWETGDKADYLFAGQAFASRGYVTAIPDYRVYPEVRFPGFVEDVAAAVAALGRGELHPDLANRPVVLIGHSAGAQIAALLALDRRYLGTAGEPVCSNVQAAIGLAGPYDFLPLREERYRRIFPDARRAASQPIAFADGKSPPLLLLTGEDDETVDPGNSARLAARVEGNGGRVELKTYEGIGHTGIVGALARPLRGRAPVLDDIDAFIRSRTGPPPFC